MITAIRVGLLSLIISGALCAPPGDGDSPGALAPIGPTPSPTPVEGPVEGPPYDMAVVDDIDCEDIPDWDENVFELSNDTVVTGKGEFEPHDVKEGSFFDKAGFKQFIKVFGIPILVSDNIGSVTLGRAAKRLASLLDSDGNGLPDNPEYIEGLLKYRVIFGFFSSGAASEIFWRNADKRPSYKPFMEQYLCNMHFVEIWQADISPVYYTSMKERQTQIESGSLDPDSKNILNRCGAATTEKFDISLWYYLFSIWYYGIVDHLTPEQTATATSALEYITDSRGFTPHYAADPEMTLADFLAWSTLTHMNALECHCTQTAVQNHWKPCVPTDLPKPLIELLDSLPNIPSQIPNPSYPNGNSTDTDDAEINDADTDHVDTGDIDTDAEE